MGENPRRKGDPFWELRQHFDRSLPANWVPLSYFIKIRDTSLLQKTGGKFPAGKSMAELYESAGHPIFLLKREGNFSYRFCPCSTKNYNNFSYIPSGSVLELAPKLFNPDGFICHRYIFALPPDNEMVGQENFFGIVNESDIVGDQYKEGIQ